MPPTPHAAPLCALSARLSRALVLGGTTALLAACNAQAPAPAALVQPEPAGPDQSHICQVSDWHVASDCKAGQKIVFLPESFGNEQLPVLFAALNCDLHYQVVATRGAVTCIFGPVKPAAPAAPAQQASAASAP